MTYSATQLGKLSGEMILEAQKTPVRIAKNGKECVAVISMSDLELLEEAKKTQHLRSAVQDGFAQIERGEFSSRSMDELFDEAKRRVTAQKSS